jgi:proteasome accessory factor B
MDRTERLLNLLGALLDAERPLTRNEIAERVPGYAKDPATFRRAFERDKDALRSMGVPLVVETIEGVTHLEANEGYRVPPEKYALKDPGLSRAEMDALALAASSVKLSDSAAATALLKLGGSTADGAETIALVDDERLPMFFAARNEKRSVTFSYRDRDRLFDPYRLSFRNGHWYVNGFDHDYKSVRTYRLDRVQQLAFATDANAFNPPVAGKDDSPWLPAWQMGDEPVVCAKLLVDADHVQLTINSVGERQLMQRRGDGSAVFAFDVSNQQAFYGYVIGFLDHAEIVEPLDMRVGYVNYLKEFVK